MKKFIKKYTAFFLVLVMIVTIGANSYTYSQELPQDIEIIEVPEDPNNPVIPDDPEVPIDPVEPVEPEEPVVPVEPVNPEEPIDPEEPIGPEEPVDPQTPTEPKFLEYTVMYYIDDVFEELDITEWQITGQVPMETPIVEEVPHDNLPEGYIVDEERSTPLPFEVSEENNVIEVYYVLEHSLGLMAIVPGGLEYPASTDPLPLWMDSTNQNSEALFAWMNGSDIYLAIISFRPITEVSFNGSQVPVNPSTVERATGRNDFLKVGFYNLGILDPYAKKPHNDHRWSVIKISGQQLTSEFTITVKTELGGGHNIVGVTVKIDSALQVYHVYDGIEVFDTDQSGYLESDFSYNVHPVYTYDNEMYELINIKVIHNGIDQGDKGPGDLTDDGYLYGIVGGTLSKRSAKITFIYIKLADGELTIRKEIIDSETFDPNQEFDIFVNGPKGKQYVVTLKAGNSKTLTGLEYGDYEIYEIVPMNYKLVSITNNGEINIDKDNKHESVTVTNRRTNDGGFYDDNERKNNFSVGVTPVSESRKHSIDFELNVILPKEEFLQEEILLEDDNN